MEEQNKNYNDVIQNFFGDISVSEFEEKLEDLITSDSLSDMVIHNLRTEKIFYKELVNYFHEEMTHILDMEEFLECLDGLDSVEFIGYQNCVRKVNNKGKDVIEFTINDRDLIAEYDTEHHYAILQYTGYLGDDYSGYMLLPCKEYSKFFVFSYSC